MERILIKVAKELNVSLQAIVEHLHMKGFDIESKPIAKVTDAMYDAVSKKFSDVKSEKLKSDQLVIGIRPVSPTITLPSLEPNIISLLTKPKEEKIIESLPNEEKTILDELNRLKVSLDKNDNERFEIIDGKKVFRLWKFIEFTDKWENADTSRIDDIAPSWFSKRQKLKENSKEYKNFLEKLKREHAIETGVVEKLYDINRGITQTLIEDGFEQSYLSHGDSDIPVTTLMNHLKDHLNAIDYVFEVVSDKRPMTTSFINELHHLVTEHQSYAEGRNQFGHKTKTDLLKGKYKERENNPSRSDGVSILYCPPEHVAAEMDSLVAIYNDLEEQKIHPIIIAAWFHHAFTTIHPYQDGNGRLVRLLASLILIKANYFPFTVLRDSKPQYIDALELADKGLPQRFVNYFCDSQRRSIEKALNVKEVTATSFDEIAQILSKTVENRQQEHQEKYEKTLAENRNYIFEACVNILAEREKRLIEVFNGNISLALKESPFNDVKKQHYYNRQIIEYAQKHNYFFNRNLPHAWIMLEIKINLPDAKKYNLGFSLHHFGYSHNVLAIGAFLDIKGSTKKEADMTVPLDINPYVVSIEDIKESKLENIDAYLNDVMILTLAQITNELK